MYAFGRLVTDPSAVAHDATGVMQASGPLLSLQNGAPGTGIRFPA